MAPKTQRGKRGKMRAPESLAFGFTWFTLDWLRKRGVCADWLKYVARLFSPFLHLFLLETLCTFAPWPFSRLAFALFTPLNSPYKTFCVRKLKIRQFHTKDYINTFILQVTHQSFFHRLKKNPYCIVKNESTAQFI